MMRFLLLCSLFVFAGCFSACTSDKTNENNFNTEKDSIMVNEPKDALITNTDSLITDTLHYSILDTLPNGDVFYIKESINTEEEQENYSTTLYLYKYDNGDGKLLDSTTIEGFNSSPLNDNTNCQWLDTCYILNDSTIAYGHNVSASNPSNEEHISESRIDFIAVSPHSIRIVLSDYLYFYTCKDYMSDHEDCEGTNTTFKTANTKSNGYFDLIVTQKRWHEQTNMYTGEIIDSSSKKSSYLMKYRDGKYEKEK